jgi:hypothetical protein
MLGDGRELRSLLQTVSQSVNQSINQSFIQGNSEVGTDSQYHKQQQCRAAVVEETATL